MMKYLFLILLWSTATLALAESPQRPYDIYLTGDRICKKCVLEPVSADSVKLTNRRGESGTYPASDIIGFNTHPIARRYLLHLTHEIGLPARVIVPQAFADERYLHY